MLVASGCVETFLFFKPTILDRSYHEQESTILYAGDVTCRRAEQT
jgi:hypothetical protein